MMLDRRGHLWILSQGVQDDWGHINNYQPLRFEAPHVEYLRDEWAKFVGGYHNEDETYDRRKIHGDEFG